MSTSVYRDLILLIGYRGTGKTTVGRLLAGRLGWRFLDADQVLESAEGRTIRQIFADEGEAGFRDKEAAVLAQLCRESQAVIATGGGVVLRPDNREKLKEAGLVVWLKADPVTIWTRMQADPATTASRPNLTVGGLAEIKELLALREPLYRSCSRLEVDTVANAPAEMINLIVQKLADMGEVMDKDNIKQVVRATLLVVLQIARRTRTQADDLLAGMLQANEERIVDTVMKLLADPERIPTEAEVIEALKGVGIKV